MEPTSVVRKCLSKLNEISRIQHPNKKIKQEARKPRFKGDYDIPTFSNTLRETRENLVEAVNDFFLS